MKRLKSLFLLICVLSITALAEIQKPASPKQPTTQDIPVTLCRRSKHNALRAPSNNPDNVITGAYNATTGTLSIYTECDSEWVLTITSSSKSATYNVSTSALLNSICIGKFTDFTIELSNQNGLTFCGEVYTE